MQINHIFMFLGAIASLEMFIFRSKALAISVMEMDPLVKGVPELPKDMAGFIKQYNREQIGKRGRTERCRFRILQSIIFLFAIYFGNTEKGEDLFPAFLLACTLALILNFFASHIISSYDWILKKTKACSKILVIEAGLILQLSKKSIIKKDMMKQEVEASLATFSGWKRLSKETQQKIVSLADALREMELTQEHTKDTLEWGFAKDFVILKMIGWEVVNESQIAANEKIKLAAKRWKIMHSYSYMFYKLDLIEGSRGKMEADCRNN